jgi:hypothetical protein
MRYQSPAVCLLIAFLALLALAGPAAADRQSKREKQAHVKGVIEAVEILGLDFPTLYVDAAGGGTASHLGRFTVTYGFTVNLLTFEGVGSAQFIAADGDSFYTTSTATGAPTGRTPGENRIVETHTITRGTGRFAGATGGLTLVRLSDLGVTSGSFEGTIVLAN